MRVTLIISSLAGGGAERVLVLLAEGFLKKGHKVAVVTIFGRENDFYVLPSEADRLALNIAGNSATLIQALWNNLYRVPILKRAIKSTRPDVVISFMDKTNVLTSVSLIKTKYPLILTEHTDPKMNYCGRGWEKLRRLTYPYASKVVSVSQGVDYYFDWLPKKKRAVIYNPLIRIEDNQSTGSLPQGAALDKKSIVAMGRLTYQKGFDLLLLAFQIIADKYPDWQLLILGEGELRKDLEALRESLCLTHQVLFPGFIKNPFPVLKNAHIFVLSSRFEGFGNVLIEAMACGLPAISTDCPSGPREIIRDGVDGILVPNEDFSALAGAMDRLMSNEEERKRLAARAPEVSERFSLEKIVGMWENLMVEVIKEKQKR